MRLLNVETFKLEDFSYVDSPPYAILSHTWGEDRDEVTYQDVLNGRLDSAKTRTPKVAGCCEQAKTDGYRFVWIDTCCIDKANSVELQEAINSMFRWYRDAALCYAYLSDVPPGEQKPGLETALSSSRWFQRGWTLQELIAPLNLRFYDAGWGCIGTKGDLCDLVEGITGIPSPYILGIAELHHASVAQRMSWAAKRSTKRREDIAYCLLGIFGVSMPMIYGEGGDKAFRRLQEQIMKDLGDDSILAWDLDLDGPASEAAVQASSPGALAPAPSRFANSGYVVHHGHSAHSSLEVRGGSLRLSLALHTTSVGELLGLLECGLEHDKGKAVGIPLAALPGGPPGSYYRPRGRRALLVAKPGPAPSTTSVQIRLEGDRETSPSAPEGYWIQVPKPVSGLELIGVHPEASWHKERALIESAADTPDSGHGKCILARFRHSKGEPADDFVAILEMDAGSHPRCNLMVASRDTPLAEIARHSIAWEGMVSENKCASNGVMNLNITLESLRVATSRRRFVLRFVDSPDSPPATVNATDALQEFGVAALLGYLDRAKTAGEHREQVLRQHLNDTRGQLAESEERLARVRAEIDVLQKEERALLYRREIDATSKLQLSNELSQVEKAHRDILRVQAGMKRLLGPGKPEDSPADDNDIAMLARDVLAVARDRGYESVARRLLAQDYGTEIEYSGDSTPLTHAVKRGDIERVRLLIFMGADVDSVDAWGFTPLALAESNGFGAIVRLLLDNGARKRAMGRIRDIPRSPAVRAEHRRQSAQSLKAPVALLYTRPRTGRGEEPASEVAGRPSGPRRPPAPGPGSGSRLTSFSKLIRDALESNAGSTRHERNAETPLDYEDDRFWQSPRQ